MVIERATVWRCAALMLLASAPLLVGQTHGSYGSHAGTPAMTPMELLAYNRAAGAVARPGEVIVAARADVSRSAVKERAESLGCNLRSRMGNRPLYVARCHPGQSLEELLALWWSSPGVRWVEASYWETDEVEPDDLDDSQWHHRNHGQVIEEEEGVPGADINTPAAWELHTGRSEVVIAPIDTGLYTGHEDLADRIWRNDDEDCDSGFDDDGNGYVDDCRGWDAGEYHNDPSPRSLPEEEPDGDTCVRWHGSMIGGLAGATGDNGAGVVGSGWNFRLMNLKRHGPTCSSASANSMEASAYAIDNGADVLVMSFNSSAYSPLYEQILQEGERRGVVYAMSAGNGGEDSDELSRFPNNFDLRNRLAVANTNNRDELSSSSNWGETNVDLAAPGTDVRGPGVEAPDFYRVRSGTSYSAPLVAGAVGLVKSAFPNLSGDEVVDAIVAGVEPLSNLDCDVTDTCVRSGGRLDVRGALREAARRAETGRLVDRGLEVDPGPEEVLGPGDRVEIRVAVGNEGGDADVEARLRPTSATGDEVVFVEEEIAFGVVLGGTRRVEAEEALRFEVDEGCAGVTDNELEVEVRDETGYGYTRSLEWRFDCEVDADGDGWTRSEDCDDTDSEVHPGAEEFCDGRDTNCSGIVDDKAVDRRRWWRDEDGDGVGDPEEMTLSCVQPEGYVANPDDCDDTDPEVFPGAEGWSMECERLEVDPVGAVESAEAADSDGCGCAANQRGGAVGFWGLIFVFLAIARRIVPARGE